MILKTLEFRHCETCLWQVVAKQGEAEVSLVIHKESIDSAKSSLRGSNATEAIHTKEIDCHESANADSRNDDFPNLPRLW